MTTGRRTWQQLLNDGALALSAAERRVDYYVRPPLDAVFRSPAQALVQGQLTWRRAHADPSRPESVGLAPPRPGLELAEETELPGEAAATAEIVESMARFLRRHYAPGQVERAGNTKTHGVVKATFEVRDDIPLRLRQGLFASPRSYPAWVRFAGPGPLSPPDISDVGVLSMGVKVVDVPDPKLMDDERWTQDFSGISTPTFTTPTVVENVKLQRQVARGTPLLYFVDPRDSHLTDMVMQGLYARTHGSPVETPYWSGVPYLLGAGQAMQYRFVPRTGSAARGDGRRRSPVSWKPPADYLRGALERLLREGEVEFDMLVQVQTDPFRMPIENASVVWPDRLSPPVPVARLRLAAVDRLDPAEQRAMAGSLSINPWHCLPEHRPLGNQNRARRVIYSELSRLRQEMNRQPHVEPAGDAFFPGRASSPSSDGRLVGSGVGGRQSL